MNMNRSQCLRVLSGLFFVFILFFGPGVAQASVFQKIARGFSNIPQSKIEEVFGIVENLGVDPKNLSKKEVRTLVRALDDPTRLIRLSLDGLSVPGGLFGSDIYRAFFFSRFDLHKHSETLFTKLFSRRNGNKELPFLEAKRNWRNLVTDGLLKSRRAGDTQITKTDLEAAAMSFVFQRFSDKYFSNINADFYYGVAHPRSWEEESLGRFFHDQFNISHYTNPHFTLTPEDPYHHLIMNMILDGSFLIGRNLSLINSKKFVLKIWSDTIKEIGRYGEGRMSGSVFLEYVVDSAIESRRSPGNVNNYPFLKALDEAGREDAGLAQFAAIVGRFAFGSINLEDYHRIVSQQVEEMSEIEKPIVYVIYDFLSRIPKPTRENNWGPILESFQRHDPDPSVSSLLRQTFDEHVGRTDPADAGPNL